MSVGTHQTVRNQSPADDRRRLLGWANCATLRSSTVLVCLLTGMVKAVAQDFPAVVPAPAPQQTFPTPVLTAPAPPRSQLAPAPPDNPALDTAPTQDLLHWGSIHLHPHLLFRSSYGNGLQAQPGSSSKTAIQEVMPGVLVDLGDRWKLDYTPTMRFYSSDRFKDSTDQTVSLNGGTSYRDWVFGLSQSYSASSQPLVETGTQTDQESFATGINASYQINRKIALELGASQNILSAPQFTSSRTWSTMNWLNYQFWPRLSAGLGVGYGYVAVDVGANNMYEQYQARLNWKPGDKLTLTLHGGVEDRQFLGTGTPALINPLFGLAVQYQVFEQTSLSLNADRAVSSSLLQSQVTETTGISGNIHQRLFGRVSVDVGAGYTVTSYGATTPGLAVSREDNATHANARLSSAFRQKGTISVFYSFTDTTSSQTGFTYSTSQVGLELGYRF